MAVDPLDVDYSQFETAAVKPAGGDPLDVDYAQFDRPAVPVAVTPVDPTLSTSVAGDLGRSLGVGLDQLGSLAGVGLRKVGLEQAGDFVKEHYDARAELLSGQMTPEQQAANATPFLSGDLTAPQSFRKIAGLAAGSAPAMALGMGVGGAATKGLLTAGMRPVAAGIVGGAGGEASVGAGLNYLDVYDQARELDMQAVPEYQTALASIIEGTPEERAVLAREKVATALALKSAGVVGLATGILGAPSGAAFAKLLGGETGKTALRSIGKQAGLEVLQEAPQSVVETYQTGESLATIDPSKRATLSELAESAVSGAIAGGVLGGAMGGVGEALAPKTETRERTLDLLKFKAQNPDVELSDQDVADFVAGKTLTGEAPAEVVPSIKAPAPLITEQAVPPLPVETATEVLAGAEPAPTPERLALTAPVNISLASGEVIPAQQFYRMLNERLDEKAGAMTKEEVIRSRRRLMREEQQFFEVQAIKAVPEEQRSGAEKAKLTKYNNWLAETVPAEAVTEQKELIDAVSEMQPVGTETRQEVQEPAVRVQGGEVAPALSSVNPLTVPTEQATLPETSKGEAMNVFTLQELRALPDDTVLYEFAGGKLEKRDGKFYETSFGKTAKVSSDDAASSLQAMQRVMEKRRGEAPAPTPPAGKQDVEAAAVKADIQAFVAANPQITTPIELSKALYEAQGNEAQVNAEYALGVQRQEGETKEDFRKRRHALYATFLPAPTPTREAVMRAERRAAKETKVEPQASASELATQMAEMRKNKPRPLEALYRNPTEEQKATHAAQMKVWNSEFNKISKAQKIALERDNAALRDTALAAERAAGTFRTHLGEAVTPANDTPAGTNDAGEALYDRADGYRYRIRTDNQVRGPQADFGGDLAPVEQVEDTQVAPAEQATLPRLKRGYRRQTFTVADPVYKNYVFVEDVSPKGVKTLYTRKTGEAEVKAATPAIAEKVGKLARTEAKFSEWLTKPNGGFGGLATVEEWRAKIRAGGIYDAVSDTFITPEERDRLTKTQARGMTYSDDLSGAVQRLDNDENYTSFDFVDDVDQLLVEMDNPPKALEAALRKVRKEQDYDRKVSGRGDMESAYAAFEAAVRAYESSSSPIAALANAIAQETGKPVPFGTFKQVSAPKGQEALFAALSQTLKKEIVFFKNNGAPMTFNGATGIAEGTIYVNIDSAKPHLVVTGHEFLHDLKREEPETYAALRDVVMDVIPEKRRLEMWKGLTAKRLSEGRGPISMTAIDEELVADFFGEQFTSKEFWAKVERRNPEGFAGLVQRLIAFLDRIKAALTGVERADIERAQTAAAEALARYVGKNPEAEYELTLEAKFSAAWHGSPHKFDKFSTSAIGTGEGAQVYGHGLYFAGKREVAEWYRKTLSSGAGTDFETVMEGLEMDVQYHTTSKTARANILKHLNYVANQEEYEPALRDTYKRLSEDEAFLSAMTQYAARPENMHEEDVDDLYIDALRAFDKVNEASNRGALYQVELAPTEDEYLRWDKPLSEQSETVKTQYIEALRQTAADRYGEEMGQLEVRSIERKDLSGRELYEKIAALKAGQPAASEYLHSLGIRGIKYPAESGGTNEAKGFNYVIFSEDDVSITAKFSETPKANLARLRDSLLSGRVTTQVLPSVLKVTPLSIVADLADAAGLPWVRTFYKATMQRDAVSNGIVTDFGLLGKELARTKETTNQVAAVADVASIHQMRPQDDIYSQDWIAAAMRGAEDTKPETKESLLKGAQTAWEAAGMQVSTGKTFREAYLASRQAFDALPEELQEHYLRAVEMMKDLRQREKDAAQALIEEYTQDNLELRAEQIAQLDLAYNNLKGNYWPVYRKGDYTLDYIETATGLRGYSTFDTVFEREVVAKSLVDAGLVDPATLKLSKKADAPRGGFGVPQGYNIALGRAIEEKAIAAATEGIDPKNTQAMEAATAQARQTAQETIQTLHEVWLRFQPEASAAKNMMRRKNIKGYDGDMVRGFLEYGQTHAVKVAQMEQGRKIERTINDMAAAIRGREGDTTREMAILNDLRAREAVKSQPSHWLAKKLGTWTTFKYMTSPSIALVQMTQLGILTLPKLATLRGSSAAKAAAALSRGTQAAFSTKFTREKMYGETEVQVVFDSLHEVVTTDLRQKDARYADVPLGTPVYTQAELQAQINALTPYQQQLLALQEAMDRGLLDISLAHEVNEQVDRKEMNPVAGKVFDLGMTFMRESEKASRKAAILAAFEVGGGQQDFFAGMETVAEVVDNTLFNYSKSAKGVALQGDLVRVLTTFQTFRVNAIGKLFVLFRQTVKGETPEVQQAAKRELIGIFGMSGILAGALGMPLGPAVFALFDAIVGDDDDEPAEEQFRKWLASNFGQTAADVAVEGVPSLLGASLSRRIGLGDVVGTSAEMPARLVGDGAFNWLATQAMGPSYSMVAGYAKGYNEIFNEGEVIKGLISSTPKPIGDALKAYGFATDGVKTGMGKRLLTVDQVDPNEVVLQAFGFAPLEISRLKREQYDLNTRSTRLSMQWGQIKQDLVKAYIDGEPTEDGLEKMREFMAKHPGLVQNAGGEVRSSLREYLKNDAGIDSRRETLLKR